MELIASHRPRLEHLKLVVSLKDLNAIEGGSMPLLHHLNLEIANHSTPKISFGKLPLLRSAVLSDLAHLCVILPWVQLTSLVLDQVYQYECVPILQQTSNLIYCELRLRDYPGNTAVVTIPCLESLVLKSFKLSYTAEHLESFITPALRRLIISEGLLGHEPIRSLTGFISKSRAKLQEVRITGRRSVPKSSYREALQSVPRLSFSQREFGGRVGEDDSEFESDTNSSDT
ncbi:F-box domain-containing protein [Mycena sanguinolenta]|uniref:F-box domain-containing protein n=1 Tax=Mycena sanguinolenta TaxID=230812 RepID=A0A8H6Y6Z1_9AGAR|nr:F-box domain-containing protein [Mycena sanguinolenta]